MSILGPVRHLTRRAYLTTLRMRAAIQQHGLVLMYHRIARPESDHWDLAVSPGNFSDHLDVLKKLAECRTLAGLDDARKQGTKQGRRPLAVTFDDGYRDNFDAALPILRKAGVPATMFITTGTIGSGKEFWWDVLERATLTTQDLPSEIRLSLGGVKRVWPIEPSPNKDVRAKLMVSIWEAIHPLTPPEIQDAIAEVAEQIGIDRDGLRENHPMDHGELRQMADAGQIEIGGHTVTHAALTRVSAEARAKEIQQGRADLQEWTGQAVDSFAAPYGKQDAAVAKAIKSAGFARACTVVHGVTWPSTDPFWIPRIQVPDMTAEALERMLWAFVGDRKEA